MTQHFRPLEQTDWDWLTSQRKPTERLLEQNSDARAKYQTSAGKLGVIHAVLDGGFVGPDQSFELQGLGIILGDVLARELGMSWRMVDDEYGVSPCLIVEGTSIVIYPQTMISKRIENGETVDVFDLFNFIAAKVDELKSEAVTNPHPGNQP